jgi:hypothetical protein
MLGRMAKETFQIAYDGEALASGAMNVYELAPALLSVGDLLKSANAILNGDSSSVSVLVESDFRKGSFEISLILDQSLIDQVKNLLPGHEVVGAAGLVGVIFGVAAKADKIISSFMAVWKLLKGEAPKEIINNDSSGLTIIVSGDGNKIQVEANAAKIYESVAARKSAEKILAPVGKRGISRFEARQGPDVLEHLEKSDLPERISTGMEIESEINEKTTSSLREALVRVTKPNFEKGQWGFSDGSSKLSAKIEDKDFLNKVKNREVAFQSGDVLKVRLRTEQSVEGGRIRTSNVIEEVLDDNPRQLSLRSPQDQLSSKNDQKSLPPSQK